MNPSWFGDSYDIVKRFFVAQLNIAGYKVYVDPMFTGKWDGMADKFFKLLGAASMETFEAGCEKSALLLDPDTGVGKSRSHRHVTISDIVERLQDYEVVFAFDQSFSRDRNPTEQMQEKLSLLSDLGAFGFFYDSHARFLFSTRTAADRQSVINIFLAVGLPKIRLVAG